MDTKEVRNQLSLYLGLDDATIDANVLPYLNSMKSRAELQDYLTGLLGNETAQAAFIRAYANSRFPTTAVSQQIEHRQAPSRKAVAAPKTTTTSDPGRSSVQGAYTGSSSAGALRSQAGIHPVQSSNAKVQIVQAPAVNVALPATTRPSTSAYTLDHVSSEAAAQAAEKKLRRLEQRLRAARGQSKERSCFCQAQEHPVSTVIPMCPQCLLILCDVNVPYNRACPSCHFRPLVSDAVLAEKIVQLEAEHEEVASKEKERLRLESEEEERAKRAIQFPELHEGGSQSPFGAQTGSIDYARKAGAGPDHYQQIKQAYRNAQAKELAIAASGERRVLSLNSKTKKVQYQTVRPKKGNAGSPAAESINSQKKASRTGDLEDDRKPYIDENDDAALTAPQGNRSADANYVWPPKQPGSITYVSSKTLPSAPGSTSESDVDASGDSGDDNGDEEDTLVTASAA